MLAYSQTIETTIQSKALNENRKIWINLPDNYATGKQACHLILLLDGDNHSLFNLTVAAKRFLEGNSADLSDFQTPAAIIVGIGQSEDRSNDFGDSVRDLKFSSYLKDEIIPYIKQKYRTANYSILIGHSLSGEFALHFFLDNPGLVNAVITASPAVTERDIQPMLTKFDKLFKPGNLPGKRAIYLSTTYLDNDATENDFRKFAEGLKKYFGEVRNPLFRYLFNSSKTLGHSKSPYFSIPEGLHFIYDPKLWQKNGNSFIDQKN